MNLVDWLRQKEEHRYERYLYLFLSFISGLLIVTLTKPSPCVNCAECSIISQRNNKIQSKINICHSNIIAFEQTNNSDSVKKYKADLIEYTIRKEEFDNILELIKHE